MEPSALQSCLQRMSRKKSTFDRIAQLTGIHVVNNQPDAAHHVIKSDTYFNPGGFAQSKMDNEVFDRNPNSWPHPEKDSTKTRISKTSS